MGVYRFDRKVMATQSHWLNVLFSLYFVILAHFINIRLNSSRFIKIPLI